MTPAEHYLNAEALLDRSRGITRGTLDDISVLNEAQVHATLALAGATFLHGQGGVYPTTHDAFVDAIMPTTVEPLTFEQAAERLEAAEADFRDACDREQADQ